MLDDYKYSIGRLVVYEHTNPTLPRQSYGQHGHERTIGEVLAVDMIPIPQPHWLYTIRNIRNGEMSKAEEGRIKFATSAGKQWKKNPRKVSERKAEDGALAELIAKALSNPERESLLRSTLKEMIYKEEMAAKVAREGAVLPVYPGDYIRVRGDLRKDIESLHNHYAKVLSVDSADIAGIENPDWKAGQPRVFRTLKKYKIITSECQEMDVYDAEIKLFYTANGRKTILNWRAATLLAETFGDEPPYKLEYEYLAEHVFTREELGSMKRSELAQTLASILYVKGKLGWRDYQRRNAYFAAVPKTHLIDNVLEASRFDARRNRLMTDEEITCRQKECFKLRRLLHGS